VIGTQAISVVPTADAHWVDPKLCALRLPGAWIPSIKEGCIPLSEDFISRLLSRIAERADRETVSSDRLRLSGSRANRGS
jgi:hypothetical protein